MNIQVHHDHYVTQSYNHKARWLSYWYQIDTVLREKPATLLEVGLGSGVSKSYLGAAGVKVTTVDIDPALGSDVVASVERLPFPDDSFDGVLAAEILEHLPFEKFSACLRELHRVARRFAVVSLPDARRTLLHLYLKLPFAPPLTIFRQVPSGKKHLFNGQHYFEIGKRGFGLKKLERVMRVSGWNITASFTAPDVPTKHFFVLHK